VKRTFFILALAVLPASESVEATVIAETRIDSTTPQVVRDSVSATSSQLGVNGPQDFGIDEAFASADIRTGELRFIARDGFQTGVGPGGSSTSASASMQVPLTFAHDQALGVLNYSLRVDFTATMAPFLDTFPLFDSLPFSGGPVQLGALARFSIVETSVVGGLPLVNRSGGVVRQFIAGQVREVPGEDNPIFFPQQVDDEAFDFFLGDGLTQVSAVDAVVTASAATVFEGYIDIDLLVNGSYTFDVLIEASGTAIGTRGVYAAASSMNTARISIDLPEGGSFTSESGLFLSARDGGVAAVPAPPPALLLLTALGAAPMILRRRRGTALAAPVNRPCASTG
jgi:hypothetical protein